MLVAEIVNAVPKEDRPRDRQEALHPERSASKIRSKQEMGLTREPVVFFSPSVALPVSDPTTSPTMHAAASVAVVVVVVASEVLAPELVNKAVLYY